MGNESELRIGQAVMTLLTINNLLNPLVYLLFTARLERCRMVIIACSILVNVMVTIIIIVGLRRDAIKFYLRNFYDTKHKNFVSWDNLRRKIS